MMTRIYILRHYEHVPAWAFLLAGIISCLVYYWFVRLFVKSAQNSRSNDKEDNFRTGLSKGIKILFGGLSGFLIMDIFLIVYIEGKKPEMILEPGGEYLCLLLGGLFLGCIFLIAYILSYSITLTNEQIIIQKLWFRKTIDYKELIPYVRKYPPLLLNAGLYCMKKKRPLRILVGYLDAGYEFTRCFYQKIGLSFGYSEGYFISHTIMGKKISNTAKSHQKKAMYKAAKKL